MTHEMEPGGSMLNSLTERPVQENWKDVGGKTVQVHISVVPSQSSYGQKKMVLPLSNNFLTHHK